MYPLNLFHHLQLTCSFDILFLPAQKLKGQAGQLLDQDYAGHGEALQEAAKRCQKCSRELRSGKLAYIEAVSNLNEEHNSSDMLLSRGQDGRGRARASIPSTPSDPRTRLKAVYERLGPPPPALMHSPPGPRSINWRYPPRLVLNQTAAVGGDPKEGFGVGSGVDLLRAGAPEMFESYPGPPASPRRRRLKLGDEGYAAAQPQS